MSTPSPETLERGVIGVVTSSTVVVGLPGGVATSVVRVVVRIGTPRGRVRGEVPPLATDGIGISLPVIVTLLLDDWR